MVKIPPQRSSRSRLIVGAIVGTFLFGATVSLGWYLRSAGFGEMVRKKVVGELEDATGGRVDLRSLRWNISRLELEAIDLTVRGLEPAHDRPLVHMDRLLIKAHVSSLLHRSIDLTYLQVDRPEVHIIVAPNGRTNVPEPKVKTGGDPVRRLFDLAIARAEFRNGELQLNEQRTPLDFLANDIILSTTFDTSDKRYDGKLEVGKIAAKYRDYREVPLAAQAEFSVWQTSAQVKRLMFQSQHSSLQVSGTINDFAHPKADFHYSGIIDLQQASAISRITSLRKGTADFSGCGTYTGGTYSLSGKIAGRNIDYVQPGSQLRNAAFTGEFQANNSAIQLNHIAARILGGNVTGALEIRNAPGASGKAQLKLAGVSLREISRTLSTRAMPMEQLELASAVGGDVNLVWKGMPSRGAANLDLTFSGPKQSAPGELALSGVLRGMYKLSSGGLELRPLQLSTAATRIEALGQIGTRTAALNVTLATTDLNEIETLLKALGQPRLPIDLAGQATFKGTVTGSLRQPELAGHLQASDFTYLYTPASQVPLNRAFSPADQQQSPPAAPSAQPKRFHFDSFAGDISYSQTRAAVRHAVIKRVDATVNLDGSTTLHDGKLTDSSAFELQASVRDGDVTRLQEIIGTNYPVTGKINLALQAAGTTASPHGRGSIMLTKAEAGGRPIDSLAADVTLRNKDVQVSNLKLKAPGGTMLGSGAYNLDTHQILVDLRTDDIRLARVPEVQLERLSTAGTASFTLHASGTAENPAINAHVRVAKLVLNEEHVGDLSLDAVTTGQQLVLTGRSNFAHAVFSIDGAIQMRAEMPGTIDIQFKDLDIDPFLSTEIKGRITGHSSVAGRAHVAGPFRNPKALTGKLMLDEFRAEVEKVPIRTDGPVEIALADQALRVEQFVLTSADSQLKVGGSVQLTGDKPLHIEADGSVNLAVLQTFDPELTSSGKAVMNLHVQGTAAQPQMIGRVEIERMSLANIELPATLADVNGILNFNQSHLEIEKLTGHVGGGQVEFAGYIAYANAITFNISSQGNDIRFRYLGVSLTANQELRLQGTLKNATVSGDITITRFAQIPSSDLAAAFANTPAPIPNATSPLNNLHLDVHIRSAPELTVQTTLAKLSGDADLRVKGTALNPVLLGRVNIAQGDIKINGQKYFLERGDLTFANPVRIDPILDVEATTRVRDFDITIGLHGTLERLTTTYRSEPPLSSEDIISLLAFGETQQKYQLATAASSGAGLGEAGGSAMIGAALNNVVSNRVSRLFGVSAIRINPAVGGPDNNPNARLTVEQQVSSDVTITYITNLARSAQQVLQFEYNVTRDYTITAIRDENGVVSFDFLVRKRKK